MTKHSYIELTWLLYIVIIFIYSIIVTVITLTLCYILNLHSPLKLGPNRSDVERNPYLPLMLFTGTVTDFRLPGDSTPMLGQESWNSIGRSKKIHLYTLYIAS